MLRKILLGLAVLVVLAYAGGWLLPGRYRVERSLVLAAPADVVTAKVADLQSWKDWSAWKPELDPDCQWTFGTADGLPTMAWSGPKLGQGELAITAIEPGRRVDYDLSFDADSFRSKGGFVLEPAGEAVRVTWWDAGELDGSVQRWFGLMMDSMIGKDFEAGLAGLGKSLSG